MSEPVTTARPTVTPTQFRTLMSTFPAGVAVVTASEPGGPLRGTTCSSVSSVSTEPATLLVCLQQDSPTLAALLGAASFAVNLLHDQAEAVAELFASRVTDRFDQVRWRHEPCFGGPHLFDGAHTIADCRVAGTALVGDHVVVFGEVFQVSTPAGPSPNPLLYGLRSYWSLGPVPKAVNTIYSARP